MKAKQDRFKSLLGEHAPQPLDFHTHEVVWNQHGFRIVQRCYCERAAQGMARFQRRVREPKPKGVGSPGSFSMGNDAQAVKVGA